MFNLEQAISEWREDMLIAGIKTPVPLDELESHLREDVERRVRSGMDEESAFGMAVKQVGPAQGLKKEFEKGNDMKRMMKIGAGIVTVMVGMALVMPAVAQYRQLGVLKSDEVVLLPLGVVITLAGIGIAVLRVKYRKA